MGTFGRQKVRALTEFYKRPIFCGVERSYTGRQLKLLRTARGVTLTDLARVMDRSRPYVSNIERTGYPSEPLTTAYLAALESFAKPPDYGDSMAIIGEDAR